MRKFLLAMISLAVGLLAISQQSFWMDEGNTIFKALYPELKDWWTMMLHLGGSDVQMPCYMLMVWCWKQLGFLSEYAMRCINLPWLVIGTLCLSRCRWWPLVFLTSPFLWYYSNELRPYAMQIAAGCVAAWSLWQIHAGRESKTGTTGLHAAFLAALFLSLCSLTSAVWAGGLWLGVLVLRPDWLKSTHFWKRSLLWLPAFLLIGGFYGFTLIKGYRAAGMEGGGILGVLFGFYELLGLAGLGPSRDALRANPMSITTMLPWLIPAATCLVLSWIDGVRLWFRQADHSCRVAIPVAVGIPILFLSTVGVLMEFRVLGRHLSPVLPAILLPVAWSLQHRLAMRSKVLRVPAATVAFCLISALQLRFSPRHAKDDYRTASRYAFQALRDGKQVLWQADMNAARYYAYCDGGFPLIQSVQVLESNPPSGPMFADVIIINRPDIRYRGIDHKRVMKENYFELESTLSGFEIWKTK